LNLSYLDWDFTCRDSNISGRRAPTSRNPGFLGQVNFEMETEMRPYYRKLRNFQGKDGDEFQAFYNADSTIFVFPFQICVGHNLDRIGLQKFDQIEVLAIRDSNVLKNSYTKAEILEARRTFLLAFPNLKRLIIVEHCPIMTLFPENYKTRPVLDDRLGRFKEKQTNRLLAAVCELHFPGRKAPIVEVVYPGNSFPGLDFEKWQKK